MQNKTEYILFADETKKTPNNPYFCFGGFIIKRCDYEDVLINKINNLKQTFFGNTSVIFHYTDMKNNKGDFQCLKDPSFRNKFWMEFVKIIKNLDIHTIGVYFNQSLMKEIYSASYYDIAYRHLIENYLHFLKANNGVGATCIESRTFDENMLLEYVHFDYIKKGSIYYSDEYTKKHLSTIEFIVKGDNCIGLQIADIIPARLMRLVNNKSDDFLLTKTFQEKLYCYNTNKQNILGLKNLL